MVESLALERDERAKTNKRYTDFLRRDEEKSRKAIAENSELRKSPVEIKQTHQTTRARLSEVELTHASLLRKIIAWGNPGPDEVIMVSRDKDVERGGTQEYRLHIEVCHPLCTIF